MQLCLTFFFQKLGDLKSLLKIIDIRNSLNWSHRVATQLFLEVKRFEEHIAQIKIQMQP